MRILRPIVETPTDLVPICDPDLIRRSGISPERIGDDGPRLAVLLHDSLLKL
jgi:hypothetical protein